MTPEQPESRAERRRRRRRRLEQLGFKAKARQPPNEQRTLLTFFFRW